MPAPYNGSRYKVYSGHCTTATSRTSRTSTASTRFLRIGKKDGKSMQHQCTAAARSARLGKCRHGPSTFDVDTLKRFVGHAGKDYSTQEYRNSQLR